jgi:hypothetical protein
MTGSQAYAFQRHGFMFFRNWTTVKVLTRNCLKKLNMPVDRLCHRNFTESASGVQEGLEVGKEHSDKSNRTLLSRMLGVYTSQVAGQECTIIGVFLATA